MFFLLLGGRLGSWESHGNLSRGEVPFLDLQANNVTVPENKRKNTFPNLYGTIRYGLEWLNIAGGRQARLLSL